MNAITNTAESDTYLRLVKNEEVMEATKIKLNLHTLTPKFSFLNHRGEEVVVVPAELF